MSAFVQRMTAELTLGNSGDIVIRLIDEEQERQKQKRLVKLLEEGLIGEATEMTDADWEELFRDYDAKFPDGAVELMRG